MLNVSLPSGPAFNLTNRPTSLRLEKPMLVNIAPACTFTSCAYTSCMHDKKVPGLLCVTRYDSTDHSPAAVPWSDV
eukprot:2921989-Pleurochrysis_carterae.AAC.1